MKPIKPKQDLVPLSEFRAHVSELLKQTQLTGRPIIITQHGRGAGVLMSADRYEKLVDSLDLAHALSVGQSDIIAGRTKSHDAVMKELDAVIDRAAKARKTRKARKAAKAAA